MRTFLELTPALAKEWDHVVYHSEDGWAFHLADWLQSMAEVWNRKCYSFAVAENGKLVAVMPLGFNAETQVLASGGWTDGGPVVLSSISPAHRSRLCEAIFAHSLDIARKLSARQFHLSLSPLSQGSFQNRWGINPLVEFGFADVSTHAWLIDLTASETQLWSNVSKKMTPEIKKARSQGYRVEQRSWAEMFDCFYQIHSETYIRNGLPPHRASNFRPLVEPFEPAGHSLLWVCFDRDGQPVGFHGATLFNQIGYYHIGCSLTQHLDNGVNPLLLWTAMLELKARGCQWYGLGEACPAATGKAKTLSDFKRRFGAEMHRWFKGEIALSAAEATPLPPAPLQPHPLRSWLSSAKRSVLSVLRPNTHKRSA